MRRLTVIAIVLMAFHGATAYPEDMPGAYSAYILDGAEGLLARYAPIFLIEDDEMPYNKIGTPAARLSENGREQVYVDSTHPAIYTQVVPFETETGAYTNLVYRVHFERNPFTLVPLNVGAGKNVGAIAVVTLNSDQKPVWLTTVQSCGCYHAIIPTDYLPKSAYPETWDTEGIEVYGEKLPGLLRLKEHDTDRIAITIRGGSHRCMDVAVEPLDEITADAASVIAPGVDMEALKHLAMPDGHETSFYHTRGWRRGLVKGAHKPLETLLFGLWAWDHNVGQDREYGPKESVGRRFYTTLFFKRKKHSDMWDYAGYLRHNGWKP